MVSQYTHAQPFKHQILKQLNNVLCIMVTFKKKKNNEEGQPNFEGSHLRETPGTI